MTGFGQVDRLLAFVASALLAVGISTGAWANGTETLGPPSIPIASGTDVIAAGVGLTEGQPDDIVVTVPLGATVQQVILYISGGNLSEGDFTPTMDITVEGFDVTTEFIGGNTKLLPDLWTVSYRADITSLDLVGPGVNTLSVGGLDFTKGSDGAGVLVIIDEGGVLAEIDVRDGNDFAYHKFASPKDVTVAQTFTFPAADVVRFAGVDFFVGSVKGGFTTINDFRPNSFEITVEGEPTAVFSDQLNSTDGPLWDTVSLGVAVPPGATSLTIQIFSRDDGVVAPGNDPASLLWVTGSMSIQTPLPNECWITTGGFHNAGSQAGSKDYTFGGNVGPPPRGSWEVVDHNTGDNFHSNDVHITSCEVINRTGPDQPGGKKGFKINKASFEGVGRLNLVEGYPFTGWVEDAGEPQGKNANDQDFFAISVRDPITNEIVFEASAVLDGGNVQIHPPTGKKGNGRRNR